MSFIVINCAIKLSFWKWWHTGIFGIICGIFVFLTYPYATQQSKTQITDFLTNEGIMQDTAVLVTVESAICFAFGFAALLELFGKKKKKWIRLLFWYPGLLLFLVLFYGLTQTMFYFTGTDFSVIAYTFALISVIMFPLLSYLVKKLVPETELRLEIHFLVSLIVCVLGLMTTVDGKIIYRASEKPLNYQYILLFLGIFLILFLTGFYGNKLKWMIKKNNK
ncbi:MAG: hypothetical protein LBP34_02320 [Flavobacteriaceae bacterium]|jgi:hypothetical protein|nr:hypothetical protein [Flavobacteriaceae bacterium]